MKKIERVAAYVRVSTQEQKLHGLSLDAQKMKLTDYAEKNKMKIFHFFVLFFTLMKNEESLGEKSGKEREIVELIKSTD